MTSPQIITRELTFRFSKSVNASTGMPDLMEVAVIPLQDASLGGQTTFAGGLKTATVELSDDINSASFDLIPTYLPGLSAPITYRVMWRAGVNSRTWTYDFAMPDSDLDWDELVGGVENIIDGEVYLQQSDLGVAGRVARLNEQGYVVDAFGQSVATGSDMVLMRSDLNVEILNRTSADLAQRSALEVEIYSQADATLTSSKSYTDTKTATVAGQVSAEATARRVADDALRDSLGATADDFQNQIDSLTAADVGAVPAGSLVPMAIVIGLTDALAEKATTSTTSALQAQLNALASDQTVVHTVASLIPTAVMPSNIALVNNSGNITDKNGTVVALGTGAAVTSVNGSTGAVSLNLTSLSAAGGSITQNQVSGLLDALLNKVGTSDTRLTNARTPTAHAASHAAGQSDAITVDQSQVTGLLSIVSNNGLTGSSAHESRIAALEVGAGGEEGGSPAKSLWFNESGDHTGVALPSQFQTIHGVALRGPWSKDGSGNYSYNVDGVAPVGETYVYPYITPNGHLELREWNESNPADPTYATTTQLNTKANQSSLDSTNATVATKASQADMTTAQGSISTLQSQITTKADLVAGRVPNTQMSTTLPIGYVSGLSAYLQRLNATTGAFDAAYLTNTANIPSIAIGSVTNLTSTLNAKADLSGGYLATAQIPPQAISNAVTVANRAAMLALSTTVAHQGTVCKISATEDAGTYILTTSDPTQFGNWMQVTAAGGSGTITSVNGYTGPTVVLTSSDVGAMATNAAIPISQVTSLQATLDAKATTAALTSGLAGKTSPTDVQNMFYLSGLVKKADYVATSAVASLAGQQSVDGVLVPVGAVVLLTAQASSVANGLWIVASGSWTRPADFAIGSFLAKDTICIVNNATAGSDGSTNNNTIWQETATSGFIATNANNWTKIGWTNPPLNPTSGNGITVSGTHPNLTFAAKTVSGGGVLATASGLSVDRNLTPGKYLGTVPAGSTVAGITHGLNCLSPAVFVYEVASGQLVLCGVTVTSANAISLEFASAPASNQFRVGIYA